ncbi:unnamed protein product [Closterium sp. NIES-54]
MVCLCLTAKPPNPLRPRQFILQQQILGAHSTRRLTPAPPCISVSPPHLSLPHSLASLLGSFTTSVARFSLPYSPPSRSHLLALARVSHCFPYATTLPPMPTPSLPCPSFPSHAHPLPPMPIPSFPCPSLPSHAHPFLPMFIRSLPCRSPPTHVTPLPPMPIPSLPRPSPPSHAHPFHPMTIPSLSCPSPPPLPRPSSPSHAPPLPLI